MGGLCEQELASFNTIVEASESFRISSILDSVNFVELSTVRRELYADFYLDKAKHSGILIYLYAGIRS